MLAEEQTALRRVAELVARGAALDEVFAAVAIEASKLLVRSATALLRYEPGEAAVVVAACNSPAPVGLLIPSGSEHQPARCCAPAVRPASTATPARHWPTSRDNSPWRQGSPSRSSSKGESGARSTTSTPAHRCPSAPRSASRSSPSSPPPRSPTPRTRRSSPTRARGSWPPPTRPAAGCNATSTTEPSNDSSTRSSRSGSPETPPPKAAQRPSSIDEAIHHAERANRELRDLVRGILPASLTRGGLRAAVESLVSDMPVPIDFHVTAPRLPPEIETTAYFIVAEALTNVVKHAHATHAIVDDPCRRPHAVNRRPRRRLRRRRPRSRNRSHRTARPGRSEQRHPHDHQPANDRHNAARHAAFR